VVLRHGNLAAAARDDNMRKARQKQQRKAYLINLLRAGTLCGRAEARLASESAPAAAQALPHGRGSSRKHRASRTFCLQCSVQRSRCSSGAQAQRRGQGCRCGYQEARRERPRSLSNPGASSLRGACARLELDTEGGGLRSALAAVESAPLSAHSTQPTLSPLRTGPGAHDERAQRRRDRMLRLHSRTASQTS